MDNWDILLKDIIRGFDKDIRRLNEMNSASGMPASAAIEDDDIIFVAEILPRQVQYTIDLCLSPTLDDHRNEQSFVESKKCDCGGDNAKKGMCPICLEPSFSYNGKPVAAGCGHIFCEPCIKNALKISNSCPVCRKRCWPEQLIKINF